MQNKFEAMIRYSDALGNRIAAFAGLLLLLLSVGCASQTRQVIYADGSTEKESSTGVLQSIQGYDSEGVGLDGSTYKTTIQNMTGDTQMASVLLGGLQNLAMIFAANSNTNLWPIILSNQTAQARSPLMQQRTLRASMNKQKPAKKHHFLFF